MASVLKKEMFAAAKFAKMTIERIDEKLIALHKKGDLPVEAVTGMRAQALASRAWAKHGFNVVQPTASLCASLFLTDLSPSLSIFAMPYDGLWIDVPAGFLFEKGQEIRSLKFARIAVDEVYSVERFAVFAVGNDFGKVICGGVFLIDQIFLLNETRRENPTLGRMFQLAMGLCLYLTSTKDMERDESRSKKGSRRDPDAPWPTRWIVGKNVFISPEMLDAGRDLNSHKSGPSWTLGHQHVVRGHFRQQACGPNHSERKTIWIAPFMKGPEGAEAWSHVYKVDES